MVRKSASSFKASSRALDLSALVRKTLPVKFYLKPTVQVARELLNKILLVRLRPNTPFDDPRALVSLCRIIETEAYQGADPASHSARGKTPRSAPMFETGGIAYVYFIYGMYQMLNFVTEDEGTPGAVLIRAAEPLGDTHGMMNGPGRLTQALGIRMHHNRARLDGPELYVIDDGLRPKAVRVSPRVGIREAKERPWRFFIDGHAGVSPVKENRSAKILDLF